MKKQTDFVFSLLLFSAHLLTTQTHGKNLPYDSRAFDPALQSVDRAAIYAPIFAFVVKQDGGNVALAFLFLLLFDKRIESADRVALQPSHRAAPVQNKYQFRDVVLYLFHFLYLRKNNVIVWFLDLTITL